MRNKVTAAALTALALVAVPAVSAADSGKGEAGSEQDARHHSGKAKPQAKIYKGRSGKCMKPKRVGFVVTGTVATMDASSLTLTVTKANRHANKWLALNAPTFATAGVKLRLKGIVDSTRDGLVDHADVLPTDRARVIGKLIRPKRGCTGETLVSVRRIHVRRRAADKERIEEEPAENEPAEGEPVEGEPVE
jgi:hypothetical protein